MNKQLIVEALRTARKYLWNGIDQDEKDVTEYICHAIGKVRKHDAVTDKAIIACGNVQMIILERIADEDGDERTFEGWLQDQPGVLRGTMTTERVQAHRLAWMNQLIEEFAA